MFVRQSARVVRSATSQRRGISGLVNKQTHVPEDQKLFTTVHRPTYLKRDSDKVIYGALLAATAFGFAQFIRGEIYMANGTHKK